MLYSKHTLSSMTIYVDGTTFKIRWHSFVCILPWLHDLTISSNELILGAIFFGFLRWRQIYILPASWIHAQFWVIPKSWCSALQTLIHIAFCILKEAAFITKEFSNANSFSQLHGSALYKMLTHKWLKSKLNSENVTCHKCDLHNRLVCCNLL